MKKGSTLANIASVFPLKPFIDATFKAFDPRVRGSGFDLPSLAIITTWGVVGAVVAVRWFRWEPRRK